MKKEPHNFWTKFENFVQGGLQEKKITRFAFSLLFCSSFFSFLGFGHFCRWSYENTKILRNLCLHFARQDGQEGKKTGKKITQLKWSKYQKPKIWDEENIYPPLQQYMKSNSTMESHIKILLQVKNYFGLVQKWVKKYKYLLKLDFFLNKTRDPTVQPQQYWSIAFTLISWYIKVSYILAI